MIFVVKYGNLFQHNTEKWFGDRESAQEHILDLLDRLPNKSVVDFEIEERPGLTYHNGKGAQYTHV